MNYLGHAYLSMGNADTLCGNMIGDYVKGMDALDQFPEGIKRGLLLHRHIDSFTDQHAQIAKAKQIFRPVYRLYSGAVVDTVMDHFIANDPQLFANQEALDSFAADVYQQLGARMDYFPAKFLPYYQSMIQHNWLAHYRSEEGLQKSLNGLMRRAKNISEMDSAYELVIKNKMELNDYYLLFMNDIISFVKIELEA